MRIKRRFGSSAFGIINYLILSVVLFLTLYPFIYVFFVSVSDSFAVARGEIRFYPKGIHWGAYEVVFRDPMILRSYLNTILYTVSGTALTLAVTSLAAHALSHARLRGRTLITVLFAITMFFKGGLIPTFLVVNSLGLIDTIWAIIIPAAFGMWYIVIARTNFKNIPESISESGYMDGMNEWQILLYLILPLSKAILATLSLFIAVRHWNNFFIPLIYLNSSEKMPLQVILRQLLMFDQNTLQSLPGSIIDERLGGRTGAGLLISIKMATIIVAVGPIVLVYPFIQKYFVKGALVGSIKG